LALGVQAEAPHAPLDKKKLALQDSATVNDEHVAALVPQTEQVPSV